MKKRMTLMLLGVAVFVAAIGTLKFQQVRAAIEKSSSFQPPPEAVTTIVAKTEEWPANLNSIGTAVAVQGVTVSADLPGIVEQINIESGKGVRQGAVLVQLDTRQERAQLAAAEAQLKLARLSFDRLGGLRDKGVVAQADYDKAAADQTQAEARVGEIRATIERKTIRAPFSGILGIRQVNLGQYLAAGDKIVPLQSLDPIYVNFSIPQQEVSRVLPGAAVRVRTEGSAAGPRADLVGKVTAIDSVVNDATRNVQVQATLANPNGKLRPGMFVETEANLGANSTVVALPASAINYAPYGDSVFVVVTFEAPKGGNTYRGVRQQFVKVGRSRGDQVAVVSGIKDGQEVVTSGVFKLRNGAAIQVNNKVQPANNPAPKPEDS
jgi:membrane fusion protein (multidrug efflux system)